jgi:hypothetical protein
MEMQEVRKILGKNEITIEDLYQLKRKAPQLFTDRNLQTAFGRLDDQLVKYLPKYKYERIYSLLEEYATECYHNGESAVVDSPENYGLWVI